MLEASWKVGPMGEGTLVRARGARKKQGCLHSCIPAAPEFLGECSGTSTLGGAPGTPTTLVWSSLAAQKNGKVR